MPLRRALVLSTLAAALVPAAPAAADLRPLRPGAFELTPPRVRPGTIEVPRRQATGRVRVVVRLAQPPLARSGRALYGGVSRRRLDTASASSRGYLRRLDAAQATAAAQLRRAIPEARVSRRYRIVLNGLAVELPATALPELVRQPFATRVYPSMSYRLLANEGPTVIGAGALSAATGARGEGVKIAVVDDGIDPGNAFFRPDGFSYPPGFPRGGRKWTTPKVIVARTFPGPGSGRGGRLALDPQASFHGTHVAGIAAGVEGTRAPAGEDHPAVENLSGVAPRAWLGNYRVFTVPTPIGHVANTPEIVAAFEAAVADGMDVINFSGGGPETEPATDALVEAVANVAAAGVVPVISAGNDRDEFGLGTAGAPGTAPDSISVAAVSNSQVFAPVLRVRGAPAAVERIAYRPAAGGAPPGAWRDGVPVVDVTSVATAAGAPLDPRLCGPARDPNSGPPPLPAGSLRGALALVSRGGCTFLSKVERVRAAGGIGVVLADNRPGEANVIPVRLPLPVLMVADEDARRLRELVLAPAGGRATVEVRRTVERVDTGRSGVVTSFSSAGPTAFGHRLKPDVAAPGGQILSATLPLFGGPFAVFDGTSMAAPHVTGGVALLLQRHPAWTPQQVKSALIATAGPAWADTQRTQEAPVTLAGGGLVQLPSADDPKVFTTPASLSIGDLDVSGGPRSAPRVVAVTDAGDGAGRWTVELVAQSATRGASVELPAWIDVPPGGEALLTLAARATGDGETGDNFGFVVLRRGEHVRRIPYFFIVERPALASVAAQPLRVLQVGTTAEGASRVERYRFPASPFGPPPDYVGPPMVQSGAERLYVAQLREPVANFGVSVVASTGDSVVDPWVLGAKDENEVQGVAGTPVNANALMPDYRVNVGAAGAALPRPKRYYVAVDSGRDPFTGRELAGRYLLRSWVNDVTPPVVLPVTTRVAAGRPTLVVRVLDDVLGRAASGVDPYSLTLAYGRTLIGAAAYDPFSGLAVFALPGEAPALRAGTRDTLVVASDLQETKNVNTSGPEILPNTRFLGLRLRVLRGPAVTWLAPERGECVERRAPLLVVAGSTARLRSVRFLDGGRTIATVRRGEAGLYGATWNTSRAARGRHVLRAVAVDARGRVARAERLVRVCRR